jgi:hypothetical protein
MRDMDFLLNISDPMKRARQISLFMLSNVSFEISPFA